mgnify:FL=1
MRDPAGPLLEPPSLLLLWLLEDVDLWCGSDEEGGTVPAPKDDDGVEEDDLGGEDAEEDGGWE